MKEKDFQIKFKHALDFLHKDDKKYEYHKISDMSMGSKPYDCYAVNSRGFFAFELKVIKTRKNWNIKSSFKGREHQLKALKKAWNPMRDNYSFVVLYVDTSRKCYCVPYPIVAEGLKVSEKGLISMEILEYYEGEKIPTPVLGSKAKKYVYNLTRIFYV